MTSIFTASETNYDYFDASYYQNGTEKGTVYHDYLNTAVEMPAYREIADAIVSVFRPERCLEIGCATGPVVKHLNDRGVESYGLDPSEWAVANKLHENIVLAGAERIPFPDNYFDLVYSCHSLEHIPLAFKDTAFKELSRVCNKVQFHMLPIIGESTYSGNPELAVQLLKKDKSHHLFLNRSEWIGLFAPYGWSESGARLAFIEDSETLELSICQFIIFGNNPDASDIMRRASQWNFDHFRKAFKSAHKSAQVCSLTLLESESISAQHSPVPLTLTGVWQDQAFPITTALDFSDSILRIATFIDSKQDVDLRIALVKGQPCTPDVQVIEEWHRYPTGISVREIDIKNMKRLRGNPALDEIECIYFGGVAAQATIRVAVSIHKKQEGLIEHFAMSNPDFSACP